MQPTKVVKIQMPKGMLLIICFFLMLLGIQIHFTVHSVSALFPFKMDMPSPVDFRGQSFLGFLSSPLLGVAYWLAIYGLYNQKAWALPFTMAVSGINVLYASVITGALLFALIMGLDAGAANTTTFLEVYTITVSLYNMAVAILMIFVIRYLKRPAIKQWFVENSGGNALESPLGDTREA